MSGPFDTVIEVIDKASGPFRDIARAFTGVGTAAAKTGKEVAKVGDPHGLAGLGGHINLLRGHFGKLQESIGSVGHSLTEFLPMLGGLGAAGSLVGLFDMTEHMSEAWGQLTATATKIGVSARQLQAFDMAAKMTDVSVDSMDTGLQRLNQTVGMAATGQNKQALLLFRHLGLNVRDASGHLRSAAELMPKLADAFQKTVDPAMRAAMVNVLFGRAGRDLIPVLAQGSAGLAKFAAISATVDYAPSPEEAEGLEAFHRGWTQLESAVSGVTLAIGAKLAPVLAPLLRTFTTWITANRDWIATGIADAVGGLAKSVGGFIKSGGLQATIEGFKNFAHVAGEVIGFLGPTKTAIGALVLVIGAPFVMALGAAATGITALTGAISSLGAVMLLNPIGLIVAAVALLGFAAYEVWKHWDWVRDKFAALWTWFKGQGATIKAIALAIGGPFIAIPAAIIEHWEPIKEFFIHLFDHLKGVFGSAIKALGPIIDKIGGAAGWVSGTVGRAGRAISGAASGATNWAERALNIGGGQAQPASAGGAEGPVATSPALQIVNALGTLRILVDFSNTPPGTRVRTEASGPAPAVEVNVGYSAPAFAY